EGPEERLPRRGGDRRSGATAYDEVRGDEDCRPARPTGATSGARAIGEPTHRHHEPDPGLSAGTRSSHSARTALLARELPRILAAPPDVLSPRMVHVIEDLANDWRRLDERIESLSGEIEAIARRDAGCERLMSVPGIGPIISSAIVAAIGKGDAFGKGRDFAA